MLWNDFFEPQFVIFSPRARQFLLPYDEALDAHSWYNTGVILHMKVSLILPGSAVKCDWVVVHNALHRPTAAYNRAHDNAAVRL